jgi:hypothetical protein
MELSTVLRRNPTAAFRIYDGEGVLVLPTKLELRVVNPTGARVWELLDGERSVGSIASVIAEEYDVPPGDAERDVLEFLQELAGHELVEEDGGG